MKLRSVSIKNFRAIESLDLRTDDERGRIRPATVLVGPNGSGKTSILFGIVQALRGIMGYRTDDVPEPDRLDIRRSGASTLRTRPVEALVDLDLWIGEDEQDAIRQVFKETYDFEDLRPPDPKTLPVLPGGRLSLTWAYPPKIGPDGFREPSWFIKEDRPRGAHHWLKGRRFAIAGRRRRAIADRCLADRIGGIVLFPQDRSLRDRVTSGMPEDPTATGMRDQTTAPRGRAVQNVWGVLQLLNTYVNSTRTSPLAPEDNYEKRIQDLFHEICAPKEYIGFRFEEGDPYGAPYLRELGAEYPLQMASSGEQVIIEYITRLTYPEPVNNSLILIDEPEVHLHPAWIRSLYLALPKMGKDNQFLLTTHSSELRALAAEDGNLFSLPGRFEG